MAAETISVALRIAQGEPYKVQIAGGEPLCCRENTFRIIQKATEDPMCRGISIQTNATLLDDETAALFGRRRVAIGVSLDGPPAINERQRGKTEAAIRGIRTLAQHGLCANLTCVVTRANAEHLSGIADLALYLGNIRGIGLDLLRAAGRASGGKEPETRSADPEALRKGLCALCKRLDEINGLLPKPRRITLREEYKAAIQLRNPDARSDYCYAAQGKLIVVLPNGDCYPCGSLSGNAAYFMGNVHHTIHPVKIRCARPTTCASCEYAAACTGGCPSRGLLSGGFDPLDCVVKKYMFQRVKSSGGKK